MTAHIEVCLFDEIELTDLAENWHGKSANTAEEAETVTVMEPQPHSENFMDGVIGFADKEFDFRTIGKILCHELIKDIFDGVSDLIGGKNLIGHSSVIANSADDPDIATGFLLQHPDSICQQLSGK